MKIGLGENEAAVEWREGERREGFCFRLFCLFK